MSTETKSKIINAFQKHFNAILAENAKNLKMTTLQQIKAPPTSLTSQTQQFQQIQEEEEKKTSISDLERLEYIKCSKEEGSQIEQPSQNPLIESSLTNLKLQFSNQQVADSEQVLELEDERKCINEMDKSISVMYLYSQPLVQIREINKVLKIFPINVNPLDNYGEYRKLTEYLEKTMQHLSIKSHQAIKEAFSDKLISRCKVLHISCHGINDSEGYYLQFEMQQLVGSLQKLEKQVINQDYFKMEPQLSQTMSPNESKTIKINHDDIRLIVLSACKSQMIGELLQKKYPDTAIIAVDEEKVISFSGSRKFTKELYSFLFKNAGTDHGSPLKAFEYAKQKMRETKNSLNSNIIIQEAEILKFIKTDVHYAQIPVFSKIEIGKLQNWNPRENPALGEDFFCFQLNPYNMRVQAFKRLADVQFIWMHDLKKSQKYQGDEISTTIKSNTLKLYKMIWYLFSSTDQIQLDPLYKSLITLINQNYCVKNEELRSLSIGDLDESKLFDDQSDTILQISNGNTLRNSLASNYVIQYCMDRRALNKAVYVYAHIGHLTAIDCDNGKELFKSQNNMPFIKFLQSVGLLLLQSRPNLQIDSNKRFIAALVIDFIDEKEDTDQKCVLLQIKDLIQEFIKQSNSSLRVILIDQKQASQQNSNQIFYYQAKFDQIFINSDSEEDDKPPDLDPLDRDASEEESKDKDGNYKSGQDDSGHSRRKYIGLIEYKSYDEAISILQEFQTANPQIQAYRDQQPFDPLNKFKSLSDQVKKQAMKELNLFRTNVNFLDGVYSGQFSKNPVLPHGYGIFIQNKSGTIYEGHRMKGLRSGYGRLIQDNGLIYEGQWSENWPHGYGCVRYPHKLEDKNPDVFSGTFNKSSRENWGALFEQQNKKLYLSIWRNDYLGKRSFVKYPDGKVKLEYFIDGNLISFSNTADFVSFYVIPGFNDIAFSVIKKDQKVNPQMIGIFDPSIKLEEIEVPSQELYESAQNYNLCLAAPLKDGYYLLFHRCTVKSLIFESEYMILEENKEFCSTITTLQMRFSSFSKKGYFLRPSDPIDLQSREARLIMDHFNFCLAMPAQDQQVKLDEVLIQLIGLKRLRVDDTLIQTDIKGKGDFVNINSHIDASINPSLLHATNSNHLIEAARGHRSEQIKVQGLFDERKFENETNKSIPMMYLFSQPLVERILIQDAYHIYPTNVDPVDYKREYRNLTRCLEILGLNLQIKQQQATMEALVDLEVTFCKVLHISCIGKDIVSGTFFELEMHEFIGSLHKLVQRDLYKMDFNQIHKNQIRLIVLSAAQSIKFGQLFQQQFPKAAVIAFKDKHTSLKGERKFMREFYTFLFKNAGLEIGTPLQAYQHAIQRMRESKNKKHFQRIKEDAETIKFIKEDVEYAVKSLFSKSDVKSQQNFNPRENPLFREEFFSKLDPIKKRRFKKFNSRAELEYIYMQRLQYLQGYSKDDISITIQSNTMKIYKIIWYLSVSQELKRIDPCYESFIPLVTYSYRVKNEELRSLSIGDFDEFKILKQEYTILQISKGNRLRNSLASNYAIQYCLDRKAINKAFYVDARMGHVRAIDYDNGLDIFESYQEMPFIRFLEQVTLFMTQSLSDLQIQSKKPLIAALVIDYVDETGEADIKQVLLSIQELVQEIIKQSDSILRVILIHQKEASEKRSREIFQNLPNSDPFNDGQDQYSDSDSDSEDDDEPNDHDKLDRDVVQQLQKVYEGNANSNQDDIVVTKFIEKKGLDEAIKHHKESHASNPFIQPQTAQYPFDIQNLIKYQLIDPSNAVDSQPASLDDQQQLAPKVEIVSSYGGIYPGNPDPKVNAYNQKGLDLVSAVSQENPNLKHMISEFIYPYVQEFVSEDLAPQITIMLTDLPIDEIKDYIQDYDCLKFKTGQAVNLLQQVTGQIIPQETQRDVDKTRK